MADTPPVPSMIDRTQINVTEQQELNYWKKELKMTADVLTGAVSAVGPDVDNVRVYLQKRAP